jgi:hypothetical protein
MTENEAIKILKKDSCYECTRGTGSPFNCEYGECRVAKATRVAIKALEEVQQYRAIGTPEELQDMKSNYFEALSDWRQYRKTGVLEECRTAREKQIPKRPTFDYNLSDTLSKFHCECGNVIKVSHDIGMMNNNNAPNYCSNCGCRLDWSDEE